MRQTVAAAFGIPREEFTWESLFRLVVEAVRTSRPRSISVLSLPYLGVAMPEEAERVSALLRQLERAHPEMGISVALNR